MFYATRSTMVAAPAGVWLLLACVLAMPITAALAASDGAPAELDEVLDLIERRDYAGAIQSLESVVSDAPNNADALNLLGYSHRKSGDREKALDYYQRALAIEPKHKGANEYLGQLYLEMDEPAKAEQRLEVLDGACFFGCEEYDELKAAIQKYRKAKGLD